MSYEDDLAKQIGSLVMANIKLRALAEDQQLKISRLQEDLEESKSDDNDKRSHDEGGRDNSDGDDL